MFWLACVANTTYGRMKALCFFTCAILYSTVMLAQSVVHPSWIAPAPRDTISQYPYCSSFEQDDSLWFTVRTRGAGVGSFVRGNPQKSRISGARTGSAAWYVGPDGNYNDYDSSVLYLPAFQLQKDSLYLLSFFANWSMDFFPWGSAVYGDGFTLERHIGIFESWETFGQLDTLAPYSWYNSLALALRNFSIPPTNFGYGWTARSQGYERQQQLFKAPANGVLRLRFRFGSDDAFTGEGVAIDDFCFQKISAAAVATSTKPNEDLMAVKLFPNPSNGHSTLSMQFNRAETIRLVVTNAFGQVVWQLEQLLEEGAHQMELQLPAAASGLHFLHWERATQKGHLRWLVQP